MNDELRQLRQAAERMRNCTEDYNDVRTVADFALPLLDSQLIDEAWLRAVGFTFPTKVRGCEQHCYAPLLPGEATSRMHVGFRADNGPFVYVSAVDIPHIKTRGELRMLARSLGIDLREPENRK